MRTQKGLNDPEWRRRAEKLAGRWYLRLGVIWTILTLILFLFVRQVGVEAVFIITAMAILCVPLLALRT
ncbi:hypothetical protein [Alicyclobacillus cycloheptanicus]|uniref:hypothetical protein n=1 Tax=Alicyclobacillus cycloheptanicus TaxID=1457 RepID=UPI00389930C3